MDKFISWMITLGIAAAIVFWLNPDLFGSSRNDAERIAQAFKNQQSNLVVEVAGEVVASLPDIVDGAAYQQFIVQLDNDHMVIISHNTDISLPIPVAPGSQVRIRGEYDWMPDGGMIHWTHRDPSGRREGGWIEANGTRYD